MDVHVNSVEEKIKQQKPLSDFLIEQLKGQVNDTTQILISPYIGFDYRQLHLQYHQIKVIYGSLKNSMLQEKDFLILRKDDLYFSPKRTGNCADAEEYINSLNLINQIENLGYVLQVDDSRIYLFRRICDLNKT